MAGLRDSNGRAGTVLRGSLDEAYRTLALYDPQLQQPTNDRERIIALRAYLTERRLRREARLR